MSTKRKATKRVKPQSTEPKAPATPSLPATVEREWLRERIEWLDGIDSYALKMVRGLHDMTSSHGEAFREQERLGACSKRTADLYTTWGLEWQHEILGHLDLLLETLEYVRRDLSDLADPQLAVTP